MGVSATGLIEEARRLVGALDPADLTPGEAAALLSELATATKVAAAGVTLVAARAGASMVWRRDGHRDMGAWVAAEVGLSVTDGRRLVEASTRLGSSPDTWAAMAAGSIAPLAAAEVLAAKASAAEARRRAEAAAEADAWRRAAAEAAAAAARDGDGTEGDATGDGAEAAPAPEPEAGPVLGRSAAEVEAELLALGCQQTQLHRLREEAARQAAAARDETAHAEHLRRTRSWRSRTFADGAVGGEYRLSPEVAARVNGAIQRELDRVFAEARRAGVREGREAYGADALCRLLGATTVAHPEVDVTGGAATGGGASPRSVAADTAPAPLSGRPPRLRVETILRVDAAALQRGAMQAGDVCEIAGVGPVSLSAARGLLGHGVVHVVIHNGVDVHNVTCLGRELTDELRVALFEEQPVCVDCGSAFRLEHDHDRPVALGGETSMDNIRRRCRCDHRDKSRREAARTIRAGRRRIRDKADDIQRARQRAGDLPRPAWARTGTGAGAGDTAAARPP